MTTWSPGELDYQATLLRAHSDLGALAGPTDGSAAASTAGNLGVPEQVLASWRRSLAHLPSQGAARTRQVYDSAQLREARDEHVFAQVLPLLRSRLIEPATEAGLIVALGDAAGRLLWVEGQSGVLRRAEEMGFVPGSDWAEDVMGTSAPALALHSGTAVQVAGAEHFAEVAHPWSCSAVPVLHPVTGQTLGIIDITGGPEAVSALVVPLLQSTARAVRDEVGRRLHAEQAGQHPGSAVRRARPGLTLTPMLRLTGRATPRLDFGGRRLELSGRHAELLALLHRHRDGITGVELAEELHDRVASEGTVRAELVRLRKNLHDFAGGTHGIELASRPYRLVGPLDSDLARTQIALEHGDVAQVLAHYRGHLLPVSDAPAIRRLRDQVHALARETVLVHGSWHQIWEFCRLPESAEDSELLMTVLRLAPPHAPERAAALVRLEALEQDEEAARGEGVA